MTLLIDERKFNILLVEDDPVNIEVITSCIGSQYQVYVAKTRERALTILTRSEIDLVLLDVNLPDGNGFEICRELIEHKHIYGELHIVFMTSMNKPEDEARGLEIGANDYITKPINSTVLKARVNLQTQLIRKTELLSNLARIDGTTEVNNRRAFDDQLHQEWLRAQRDQTPLSLCMLDIDYFKQFNDTYGHPAGDECLRLLSQCLKKNFKRASDFVARYGGEEFVILLGNTDSTAAEALVCGALKQFLNLQIPHKASKVSEYVSFSAGISTTVPDMGKSFDLLIERADKQLYLAKEQGRARVFAMSF